MIGPAPAPPVPPPKDAKNVLLLIVDDMRPQLNAAYGQTFMITPNLDRLAKSPGAVVFDRAYVQVAWCSPSRNSFLTSRYPDTLQIWNFGKSFRDTPENPPDNSTRPDMKVVPLPQWFKHNGYLSLGGGKVYHPNQPANNDVPYSWSDGPIPYFNFSDPDCPNSPGNNKVGCQGCPEDAPDEKFYDWKLANHTIHALRAAKNDAQQRPFFIAAGFRRPHTPWHIAQRFVDMYPTNLSDIPPAKHPSWAHGAPPCAFVCGGDGVGCDFDIDHPRNSSWSSLCRRTYYAAVTATDHYIGLVLDELDALGLTSSTAVAVFGDHGVCVCVCVCVCARARALADV